MVHRYLSVSKKLDNVTDARDSGNLYATYQKHNVQSNQIREWQEKEQLLIEKKMFTGKIPISGRVQTL